MKDDYQRSKVCDVGRVLVIEESLICFLDVSECKEEGWIQARNANEKEGKTIRRKDDYLRSKGM